MSDLIELWEQPEAEEMLMFCGWRQWADAGSCSSALPRYIIKQTDARQIGTMKPDGFYMFQIPGTHDLVRPVVKFDEGFPESLETERNEIYYTGDEKRGIVIFLGSEPHLDVERYIGGMLDLAQRLNVKRIFSFAGVYGELPYDQDRIISCSYSKPALKTELERYAVNFSDYHGGASIGSFLARRAADRDMEYIGFYALVPTYDFSAIMQSGQSIRLENDFMAWEGILRRVDHMLKWRFDFTDLEERSQTLRDTIDAKIDELDNETPSLGVREYLNRLSENFEPLTFDPLDDVWDQAISHLFDDNDTDEQ